jgi:hypothetical protein
LQALAILSPQAARIMDCESLNANRLKLAANPELWQFSLLSSQEFSGYARSLGMSFLNTRTVFDLWRIGLLRADLVTAANASESKALKLIKENKDISTFCDMSHVVHRQNGYAGIASRVSIESRDSIKPYFHPFRLYVLHHIRRVFATDISYAQFLLNPAEVSRIQKQEVDFLDQWISETKFAEQFEHWNRSSELAIVLEPGTYRYVYHEHKHYTKPQNDKFLSHQECIKTLLRRISIEEINGIRSELCQAAELLDSNKMVHVLLRLMTAHERLKLRSNLGACMQFRSMAEIIRRSVERTTGENLPEEDEVGFGTWSPGARKSIYGAERITEPILDSLNATSRQFINYMGLDYGTKVRCYLEGNTEIGALTWAVREGCGVEFINLQGQVLEKRGRGLNFIDSLRRDRQSQVFSVVLLDVDSDDNIRALKRASKDDEVFVRFFLSDPDFEFHNFTADELLYVYLSQVSGESRRNQVCSTVASLVENAKSGKEFFEILQKNGHPEARKGQSWGKALMNFAFSNPMTSGDNEKGATRPVLEIIDFIRSAWDSGYMRSVQTLQTDPHTGRLVERS